MKLHVVYGHDNGRYALRDRPDVRRCGVCGGLADKWDHEFRQSISEPASIGMDISSTYDGVVVVSPRFRAVVGEARLGGLTLEDVGSGYAVVRAIRRVGFDTTARRTRFETGCRACGRYESVVGATPAFLMAGAEIGPYEFVWTDIEFGTGDEKSPLLICGDRAAKALRRAKLKGLDFAEVRAS